MIKQDMRAFRIPEPQTARPAPQLHGPALRGPQPGTTLPAPRTRALRQPSTQPQQAKAAPPRGVSLRDILCARWHTFVGVVGAGMLLAMLGLLQFTPVYQATAIIAFDHDPTGPSIDKRVRHAMERLRSWELAEKIILKLNLTRDPEINTALTRRSFYQVSTWVKRPGTEAPVTPPPGTGALTLKPALIAELAKRLDVSTSDGRLVRVTWSGEDPAKAARIANALVAQLRLEQQPGQGSPRLGDEPQGQLASGLATQLAQVAAELRQAQDDLERGRVRASPPSGPDPTRSAQSAARMAAARRSLEALEARDRKIGELLRKGASLEAVASIIDTPEIDALHQRQTDLARKAEELATMFGAGHPETVAVQDEQREVEDRISNIIKASRLQTAREIAQARRTLKDLDAKERLEAAAVQPLPGTAHRLVELEAAVREKRVRYETLLARTLAPEATDTIGMRVAQAAAAPSAPVFPDHPVTLGMSLAGSTLLALGLVLVQGPIRTGLRRSADIERAVKLPNLGHVPEAQGPGRLCDSLLQDPHSPVSTALSALQASLSHAMADAGQRVVALTAPDPGAGTTSIAVALGRIAARDGDGRKVLVVDADFSRADLAAQFAPPASFGVQGPEEGLVEVLSGEADLCHAIRRDRHSSLHYLPIVASSSSPAELVATRSMQRLMQALRDHYSLVIINAPSLHDHPEARALALLADTSLVVVNWNETPRPSLVAAVASLREAGAHILGTVLNRCGQRQPMASH